MSKFLAIDFETANNHKLSACSVGAVFFDEKNIIGEFNSLIRPPTNYDQLWSSNFHIHGISRSKYMKANTFPEVWKSLQNKYLILDSTIVCHNSGFDINILLELFSHYKISTPKFYYLDTVNLAKLTWKSPNYKLSTLANKLNIPLNHHDALSDSLACAKIAMNSLNYHKTKDFNSVLKGSRFGYGVLEKKKNISMGSSKIKSIAYKEFTSYYVKTISNKFCSGCNRTRQIKHFLLDRRTSDGFSKLCIDCFKNKTLNTFHTGKDINEKFEKIIETRLNETKYSDDDTASRVQNIISSIDIEKPLDQTKESENVDIQETVKPRNNKFKFLGYLAYLYVLLFILVILLNAFR